MLEAPLVRGLPKDADEQEDREQNKLSDTASICWESAHDDDQKIE